MTDTTTARHGIGGNAPPEPVDDLATLRERLQREHATELARVEDLEAAAGRVPPTIEDEVTAGKLGDLIKLYGDHIKELDTARAGEKAPFDRLAATVHGFFMAPIERLKKTRARLLERQTAFLRRKEAEERAERERVAEEARQRAEAERQRLAALAAEEAEKRRVAEEARRAAERQAEAERQQRRAAEAEAERLRQAEQRRQQEEAARQAAEAEAAAQEAAPEPEPAAEPAAAATPVPQPAAEPTPEPAVDPEAAHHSAVLARAAMRRQQARARLADADAEAAEARTRVKAADLGRTRSDYGSVSTIQELWTFKDLNREKLDLKLLRPFIPAEALEQAVRAAIKAGVRSIKGVTIYQTTAGQVR